MLAMLLINSSYYATYASQKWGGNMSKEEVNAASS